MNAVSLGRDEAGAFARRLAQRREALGLRKQDLAKNGLEPDHYSAVRAWAVASWRARRAPGPDFGLFSGLASGRQGRGRRRRAGHARRQAGDGAHGGGPAFGGHGQL